MRTYQTGLLMLAVSVAVGMVAARLWDDPPIVPQAAAAEPAAAQPMATDPVAAQPTAAAPATAKYEDVAYEDSSNANPFKVPSQAPSLPADAVAGTLTEEPGEDLVASYRRLGPKGLEQLFDELDSLRPQLEAAREDHSDLHPAEVLLQRIARLERLIDAVGGQRHCTASRLYWYTSWGEAVQAAQASGKPILSLRMLGQLTDELSCANSRFFRTTLYANQEVSSYLREHFILHWRSVRPVPKVTIDFGDGRKLVRTITGNSAHYVVASTGEVVDTLPGLYGPAAFLEKLQTAEAAAVALAKAAPAARQASLRAYHRQRLAALDAAWRADLERLGRIPEQDAVPGRAEVAYAGAAQRPAAPPPARAATAIAAPKALMEMPLVAAITPPVPSPADVDEQLWAQIAKLHIAETALDNATEMLIRSQAPMSVLAGELAVTKRKQESPLLRMLVKLRSSIALDTVRNEYLLHRQIHQWFVNGETPDDLENLNERVYAELFLTPSSDPWLGLITPDTYTALENDGIVYETAGGQ